jgi:hypothetical protein
MMKTSHSQFLVLPMVLGLVFASGCADANPGPEAETLLPCKSDFENSGGQDPDAWNCALPEPCSDAVYLNWWEKTGFEDPAAARCILSHLRDRTISQLSYRYDLKDSVPGQYANYETIYIVNAEHGLSNLREMRDLGSNLITTNRALLRPASYFEECLTHTDDLTLMNCIRGWSSGCADVAVTCP